MDEPSTAERDPDGAPARAPDGAPERDGVGAPEGDPAETRPVVIVTRGLTKRYRGGNSSPWTVST
ncbi:hypothetical protein GCM10017687_35130 [Streptomyces echinatus]